MNSPISPEFQYIIYKERERELEIAIQRRLEREARGIPNGEPTEPWYAAAVDWLKERMPFQTAKKQLAAEAAGKEEPCPAC